MTSRQPPRGVNRGRDRTPERVRIVGQSQSRDCDIHSHDCSVQLRVGAMQAAIAKARSQAAALRAPSAYPDERYAKVLNAQSAFAEALELMANVVTANESGVQSLNGSMQAVGATMSALHASFSAQSQSAQSGVNSRVNKPASESRCVSSLLTLGSDKSQFKSWNEKLISVLFQTLGLGWRKFMRSLHRQLDQDRRILDVAELDKLDGAGGLGDSQAMTKASEDIFYILVEKQSMMRHCGSIRESRAKVSMHVGGAFCTYLAAPVPF